MKDPKGWLQSTTIWGVLILLAPFVSPKLGFDLGATLNDILVLVGTVTAIIGRFTARTPLSAKPVITK